MDNFEENVWKYGLLDPEEQAAIEAYVVEHPGLAPTLKSVKALYDLVGKARLLEVNPPGDSAIAYYVANEYMRVQDAPAGLEEVYQKLGEQVAGNEEVNERYIFIKRRMEEVAAHSNPVSQFEKLTGLRIEDIPVYAEKSTSFVGRVDRPPALGKLSHRARNWKRSGVYASAILIIATGVLFNTNKLERLAYTDPGFVLQDPLSGLRSEGSSLAVEELLFKEGVDRLLGAQRNTFGLYYSYNTEDLKKGEQKFLEVLEMEDANALLIQKTRYLLGKIYIALGQKDKARDMLSQVMNGKQDEWADRSRLLLLALS